MTPRTSAARTEIVVNCTKDERDWVRHAARLRRLSLAEYVKQAINRALRHDGVDAVLLRERGE